MQRTRISVIVVAWNAATVLDRCLETLRAQGVSGGLETIVVDNASTDGTAAVLARHRDHVRVLGNEHNAGFPAASNQGAAVARGEVLVFLNPDTELLSSDALERLARVVDDPAVGLAGPRLLNPDGTLQPSCAAHPSVGRALLTATGLRRLLPARALARVAPERGPHDRPADTGWLMGAALAVRADLFAELGGFWPRMYAEDEDLALRVQRRGLRVRFEPGVRVMHVGNHSASQRWSDPQRAERIADAELAFLGAHYGRAPRAAIRAIVGAGYAARAVAFAALRRRDRAGVYGAMARRYASRG